MRDFITSLIVSFALAAISLPSFAADYRDGGDSDRNTAKHSHQNKEDRHHKNKDARNHSVLVVKMGGVLDTGWPCPTPRDSMSYRTITAAVECARDGDTLRVLKGVFETDGLGMHKDLTIIGRGPTKAVILNGDGIAVTANVAIKQLTISWSGGSPSWDGGAIETYDNASVVFDHCVMVNGNGLTFGGAIRVNSGTEVTIKDSALTANHALLFGGAIDNHGTLRLVRTVIAGKKASWGGGIHNSGKLIVSESLITGNNASEEGGGIYNRGEAVFRKDPIIIQNEPEDCVGCP